MDSTCMAVQSSPAEGSEAEAVYRVHVCSSFDELVYDLILTCGGRNVQRCLAVEVCASKIFASGKQ